MRKIVIILPAICLVLSGCNSNENTEPLTVSGGKTAVAFIHLLTNTSAKTGKPSAALGIFTGLFTSQGIFLPVKSAMMGFEAQRKLLEAFTRANTDENYALLQEVGGILQVDVIDMLNRSENRKDTLNTYIQSLRNAGILLERKIGELEILLNEMEDKERGEKKVARDLDREVNTAVKDQDYATASMKERELQEAKSALAETSTRADQTKDMLKRFKDLLDVAAVRLQAMENNREILIAGLRVIEVPGITDLGILEKGKSYSTRKKGDIFSAPR